MTTNVFNQFGRLLDRLLLPVLGLILVSNASAVTFTATPATLNQGRYGHTATLLPNGKVLLVGGFNFISALNTTELYDPLTGTRTAGPSLASPRTYHTATLLPNGKVLVAGGLDTLLFGSYSSTTEIYDPVANTWSAGPPMNVARGEHTAILLNNGKVLVVGGYSGGGTFVDSAALYDCDTNTWTPSTPLNQARSGHMAVLLQDGRVLIAGGAGNGFTPVADAEIYDASGASRSAAGTMKVSRFGAGATLLADGKVLVAGGTDGTNYFGSVEFYGPGDNSWTEAPTGLSVGRSNLTMHLLPDGTVLAMGGTTQDGSSAVVERYFPSTAAWATLLSLTTPRISATSTMLHNGHILIAGGLGSGGTGLASMELCSTYTFTASNWRTYPLNNSRSRHTMTVLANGFPLLVGGVYNSTLIPTNSTEVFNPNLPGWVSTPSLPVFLSDHAAALLQDGRVLVAGGNVVGFPDSACYLRDSGTGNWSTTGSLSVPRASFTLTRLQNGKVLAIGGDNRGLLVTASPQIYDPSLGTWTDTTGNMNVARRAHTATLLANGKVLVAGGTSNSGFTTSAELFDPATGLWTATGDLNVARQYHTATLLADGRVLVVGNDFLGTNIGELYDPTTGFWTPTTAPVSLPLPQATLLGDGRVLVSSGGNCVIYDPVNGWSFGPPMNFSRTRHTAASLPGGGVMVAGGATPAAQENSEILDTVPRDSSISVGNMQVNRQLHSLTLLPNGNAVAIGGRQGSTAYNSAETYNASFRTWFLESGNAMSSARYSHTATLLASGKILVTGGFDSANVAQNSADLFSVAGSFTPTGSMTTARAQHTATPLINGKILVAGGSNGSASLNGAELYNPATGTWAATGNLTTARQEHTATFLPLGKVLVVGGRSGGTYVTPGELYDPFTGTWSAVAAGGGTRIGHSAVLLQNGKVLVAGGSNASGQVSACELYDPVGNTWSSAGSLVNAVSDAALVALPSGRVLAIGGTNGGETSTVQVYDPEFNNWRAIIPMLHARSLTRAVMLLNGWVLVSGRAAPSAAVAEPFSELMGREIDALTSSTPELTDVTFTSGVALDGSKFRGPAGSTGAYNESAGNTPIVQVRNLATGTTTFAGLGSFSGTNFSSSLLPPSSGYSAVTLIVNGVPSNSRSLLSYYLDAVDYDGDGLSDLAEINGTSLGLHPLVSQPSLVAAFHDTVAGSGLYHSNAEYNDVFDNPNNYDLYRLDQVQALHVDAPLIQRNPATGKFTLTLGVSRATDLGATFQPFDLDSPGATTAIDNGKLEFEFTSGDNAAFFRVETE